MNLRRWFPRPEVTPWLITCCGLAVPVVYLFEQQFYEVVVVILWAINMVVGGGYMQLDHIIRQTVGHSEQTIGLILVMIPVCFVMFAIGLVVFAVILACAVPYLLASWLVTNPGLPRYVLDLVLVWYLGVCLYGVLLPILWRLTEPLIAHTLGEIAFQRARARVCGQRPRYTQPFYLSVAIIGLIGGGVRVVAPIGNTAAAGVASGWRQISNPALHPVLPTVPPWPKVFTVAAGQVVDTGIMLGAQEEVAFRTSADLIADIGTVSSTWIKETDDDPRAAVCIEPNYASRVVCRFRQIGAPSPGEIRLRGAQRTATVHVYGPPQRTVRRWLAAGETYRPNHTHFRKGNFLERCAGNGLLYRMHDGKRTSPWIPLDGEWSCSYCRMCASLNDRVPMGGEVELKPSTYATWVATVRPEQ